MDVDAQTMHAHVLAVELPAVINSWVETDDDRSTLVEILDPD